jgi:hypothetical protein
VTNHLGLVSVDRSQSDRFNSWRNGTDLGESLQVSVAPQDKEFFLLAANGASGAQSWIPATCGAAWVGRSLGSKQASMYTLILAYMQAIGAA